MKTFLRNLGIIICIVAIFFATGECETVLQQILLGLGCIAVGFVGFLLIKITEE